MEKQIASIPKNATEEIRVSLTEYKGHQLCDLRVFFETDDGQERKPSRKGITFKPELLPDVLEALKQAAAEIEGE